MALEQAVQEFLNGEMFRCPASAAEIVTAVTDLREFRENEIYLNILNALLTVLQQICEDPEKRFPDAVLHTVKR